VDLLLVHKVRKSESPKVRKVLKVDDVLSLVIQAWPPLLKLWWLKKAGSIQPRHCDSLRSPKVYLQTCRRWNAKPRAALALAVAQLQRHAINPGF